MFRVERGEAYEYYFFFPAARLTGEEDKEKRILGPSHLVPESGLIKRAVYNRGSRGRTEEPQLAFVQLLLVHY